MSDATPCNNGVDTLFAIDVKEQLSSAKAAQLNSRVIKANGQAYSKTLDWSVQPQSVSKHLTHAYNGDELTTDLTWPAQNIAWIAMPSFANNDKQTHDYNNLYKKVTDQRTKLLSAKTVVLDLRHNQGGSSYWSLKLAKALWGEQVVEQKMDNYSQNSRVWW